MQKSTSALCTTLLAPKLARARILTYGYDAYIVRKEVAGNNGLVEHAANLVNDLTEQRRSTNSRSRPIVFVAHSLGGLVCKKAILLSRNPTEPHLRDIFDSVRGIVFLGTPHRGSWLAKWADIPATLLGVVKSTNNKLLDLLKTDEEILKDTREQFLATIREQHRNGRRLEVTCFVEELPVPGVGLVVCRESATLEGYTAVTIHGNHMNMVKFASDLDNGFKRLLGELQRWIEPIHVDTLGLRDDSSYVPQKHSSAHFVGRSEHIDRMASYFQPRGDAERPGRREFIIYGPGGFGKTQLCLRFAEEHSKSFWRVYWIDASTTASLHQGFRAILNDPECRDVGPDPVKAASQWLSKQLREWLVILDNADDDDYVRSDLSLSGNRSNVIMTTRNTSLRRRVPPHGAIAIETLSDNEAKQLLWTAGVIHRYRERTTEVERHLAEIAQTLHGIPLALQHAASAIQSEYCDLGEYRQLFDRHRKSLLDHQDYYGDTGYNHTLYSAWSLSIDSLEKKSRRELPSSGQDTDGNGVSVCPAVELLSLFSFFHHSMISKTIFHRAAAHMAGSSVPGDGDGLPTVTPDIPTHFVKLNHGSWDSDLFRRSIQALQGASLIQSDAVEGTWSIHPLIHVWSRDRLADENQRQRARLAARAILVQATANGSRTNAGDFVRQMIPHMTAFGQALKDLDLKDNYADDYASTFWRALSSNGYFAQAEVYAKMMKDGRDAHLGPCHRRALKATETLAVTMKENPTAGKLDQAIGLLQHTLVCRIKHLSEKHPDCINNMVLLGSLYLYKGSTGPAEEQLKAAWVAAKETRGETDLLSIRAATELGSIYATQKRLGEAESLQRETLKLAISEFGRGHEKTLGVMGTLAVTLTQLGQLDHPDTLLAKANLAATYCRQERWQEAETLAREVNDKRIEVLGPMHRETLRGRLLLANCYMGQQRFTEAAENARVAVEGRRKILGDGHDDTKCAMEVLAKALEPGFEDWSD
ncbi:hypothetical protein O9K51_09930 [Purpureocillium lavendulum]|uniref:NB-ARC domain-containing protein n=1 Tax=Purpureocillium lavendulum TaxID=1247861 RepID=A0AB34FFB3_9HYPO|nr:hypothetical protein O9K51_09930 [Purpureocillium lavendulum]